MKGQVGANSAPVYAGKEKDLHSKAEKKKAAVYHYTEFYGSEWAEMALKDYQTYPPMRVWGDSLKYVFLTLIGNVFPFLQPKVKDVKNLKEDLLAFGIRKIRSDPFIMEKMLRNAPGPISEKKAIDLYRQGVEEMWPKLEEILLKNKGLFELMRNGGGVQSLTFAKFPADLVPHARALESAWGNNYDNAGIYRILDRDDISARYAVMEPIFADLRRRTYIAHQEIMKLVEFAKKTGKRPRVISLGAGLLIEFRKYGITLDDLRLLDIVACDADKSLKEDLDTVLQFDFGVSLQESGIDYRFAKIDELFKDTDLQGSASLVLMDGVLSYCSDSEKLAYVIGMKTLLNANGKIICDFQILEPSLIRCKLVHEWKSKMKPELSVKKAINKMANIATIAELELTSLPDERNPRPLGVVFILTPDFASGEVSN